MMWLDGDILQVYWNGYHHVAAYLGNILVWRENIRAIQGINYISTEVPSANTTLCLGISAKASETLSRIAQQSDANAVAPKVGSGKSTLHANVQVYGDAFARAARMPEGILPISVAPDLATVISALAKAAASKPDHGFIPASKSNACTSIPTNADTDTTFNPDDSTAQRRPAVPQSGGSHEQFTTDNSESTSVPKTLVYIDTKGTKFTFNGQPSTKEPTPITRNSVPAIIENLHVSLTCLALAEIITWEYPVQEVDGTLRITQVYSAEQDADSVLSVT